jgi:hypothetical protein
MRAQALVIVFAEKVSMPTNSAAHPDTRASAVLCKGHSARASGCER